MKFAENAKITSNLQPEDLERTTQWILEMMSLYEDQRPDIVDKCDEDEEDGRLEIPGFSPISGKETLKAHYAWLFKGVERTSSKSVLAYPGYYSNTDVMFSSVCKVVATILPDQIHLVLKATFSNKHRTSEPTYDVFLGKDLKPSKVKYMKLTGDVLLDVHSTLSLSAGASSRALLTSTDSNYTSV
ncbi:hypothetical protein CC1G_05677 [Coprinopsis cinerea okayama7|uniref:Uncharacterized protein n=1 Tax=Coprinopsis cinerea (strain Okayama-7 / 130 / ATCC MYA-4618 / FGSC 9003) TaxID=240176 RepID=A8N9V0_COPC7|nr:hypothetical protein CC1G_05677 [Coprinopsis cinerea okayama7\|eukprot:XP_001831606.2 hypothetical protein CC1G_05677 [Coprinopsis cinerea okayama7\